MLVGTQTTSEYTPLWRGGGGERSRWKERGGGKVVERIPPQNFQIGYQVVY